ncbi:MAG: YDG domain-containing protein, partial [Oscillospiraceae bacterium]
PTKAVNIQNGEARTGTITLADLFGADNVPTDAAFGTIKAPTPESIMAAVSISGTNLAYTSNNNAIGTKISDVYAVAITSKNYDSFDATITFKAVDKEKLSITGLSAVASLTYSGAAQSGYTGTAIVQDSKVPVEELVYTYTSTDGKGYNDTKAPTNAGAYKLVVSVAETNTKYSGAHTDINFTIAQKALTVTGGTVTEKTYDGNNSATVTELIFDGLVNGEALANNIDYSPGNTVYTTVSAGTDKTVMSTVSLYDTATANNYSIPTNAYRINNCVIHKVKLTGGTINAAQTKPYDGETSFDNATVTYIGGVNGNTPTGTANGTVPSANAGATKALTVTSQALDAAYAINYIAPSNDKVTGSVEITKINPIITLDAPTSAIAGNDVTVTMTITNPTGANAGFPSASEISIVADANAAAKGKLTQSGTKGVYKQEFTIDKSAQISDKIKFTASVPADTANYIKTTVGTDKSLTVSDKYGTQTAVSADKVNITYGDGVTLTATVTKTKDADFGKLSGKVQFKANGNSIGTEVLIDKSGKATLAVDKATLTAISGGKTHSFTADFTSANTDYANSTGTANVIVAQKPLTITAPSYSTYQYKELPLLTNAPIYTGFADGEGAKALTATYTADYEKGVVTDTEGDKVIKVKVTGTEANTNYAITLTDGKLTVYRGGKIDNPPIAAPTTPIDKPVIVAEASDPLKLLRILVAPLSADDLRNTGKWLLNIPEISSSDISGAYEMDLQVSANAGASWTKALETDIKGKSAKLVFPFPDGTSTLTHYFRVFHFTNGADKAAVEMKFTSNEELKSLYITSSSLSPFVVVATPKLAPPTPPTPPTPSDNGGIDNTDYESNFWVGVTAKIQDAKKGDVVKVNIGSYSRIPATIMELLRLNNVGMVISRANGKAITIPAGKAKNAESGRIYWQLSELAELYKNYTFTKIPDKTNPSTNGFGYYDSETDTTVPVTGAIVEISETPRSQNIFTSILSVLAVTFAACGIIVWKKKNFCKTSEKNNKL